MSKTPLKPRILIVDDNVEVGNGLKEIIEDEFDCTVYFPPSIEALEKVVRSEAFDSVLVDADLSSWRSPASVFDREVHDGIDFARAYCGIQQKALIVICGAANLPSQPQVNSRLNRLAGCNVKTIPRPLPLGKKETHKALAVLAPRIDETKIIHRENPIFQPMNRDQGMPRLERELRGRLLYRQARQQTEKWANYYLRKEGDSSWVVLCGGKFQEDYFGEPLNGDGASRPYPGQDELANLAGLKRTRPFLFWNTSDTTVLSKQFADGRFKKIPDALSLDFSMAVASDCARAYKEGEERHVMEWCRKLEPKVQLEPLRAIFTSFKNLNGDAQRSIRNFSGRCRRAQLNRVVDVYEARVEKLVKTENTATVELTSTTSEENFMAPFDLTKLNERGVRNIDQCFEYTVYADVRDHAFGEIELTE